MFFRLEEPVKDMIDDVEETPFAAKVCYQRMDASATRPNFLYHALEGLDIGSAEGIDRLFGISYDKQFSRFQVHILPCSLMATRPFTEIEDNLVLHRIGVLKLIYQNRPIGLFDSSTDGGMVTQKRSCP